MPPQETVKWRAEYGQEVPPFHPTPGEGPTGDDYLRWEHTQTKWLDTPPSKTPPALSAEETTIKDHIRNLVFYLEKNTVEGQYSAAEHWAGQEIEKCLQQPKDGASLSRIVQNINSSLDGTNLRLAIESGSERKLWVAKYSDQNRHFQSFCVLEPPRQPVA